MGIIDLVRGNNLKLTITLVNQSIECDKVIFSVKENVDDTTILIEKTLGNGVVVIDNFKYSVELIPEDSKKLNAEGYYLYELVITRDKIVKTIASGKLHILNNITEL